MRHYLRNTKANKGPKDRTESMARGCNYEQLPSEIFEAKQKMKATYAILSRGIFAQKFRDATQCRDDSQDELEKTKSGTRHFV